ncbi:NTP transferase domain-containing protein, partial [Candidatus Woesearchaeota archaeon]|nr:NTP transferase domain-containing protein [Candidatus Woesearchaeota archaeon]
MEKVQIIILAAGKGKRMNSEDIPKVLIEINNEPIIKYALKSIKESKICKKPIIVIGFQGQKVVQALGTNYNYIEQKEQLGTGHAVGVCKDHLENKAENILVLYGDHPTITPKMLKDLVKSHIESKSVITLTTIKIPDFNDWRSAFYSSGRIIRNNKGEVSAIVEKKDASPEQLNITELNASYLCFNAKWLWENITKLKNNNSQKEYYLTDFLKLA